MAARGMDRETVILQAVTQMAEVSRQNAQVLEAIKDNLKILNDQNILHSTNVQNEHKQILDTLKIMTTKYWWLIIGLMVVVLVVLGYKEATQYIIPVG